MPVPPPTERVMPPMPRGYPSSTGGTLPGAAAVASVQCSMLFNSKGGKGKKAGNITSAVVDADGTVWSIGDGPQGSGGIDDPVITLRSPQTAEPDTTIRPSEPTESPFSHLVLCNDAVWAVTDSGQAIVFDTATRQQQAVLLIATDPITCVVVKGHRVYFAMSSCVKVYDGLTCQCTRWWPVPSGTTALTAVTARAVVTGHLSGHLRSWDCTTGSLVKEIEDAHQGEITCLLSLYTVINSAATPPGHNPSPTLAIVSAGVDSSIRVWHEGSTAPLAELRGHSSPVKGLVVLHKGTLIASCGLDGRIVLWDICNLRSVGALDQHQAPLHGLASVQCMVSSVMWSLGTDGSITVWALRANDHDKTPVEYLPPPPVDNSPLLADLEQKNRLLRAAHEELEVLGKLVSLAKTGRGSLGETVGAEANFLQHVLLDRHNAIEMARPHTHHDQVDEISPLVGSLLDQLSAASEKIARLTTTTVSHLNSRIEDLLAQVHTKETELKDLAMDLSRSRSSEQSLRSNLTQRTAQIDRLQSLNSQLSEDVRAREEQIHTLQGKLKEISEQREVHDELSRLQVERVEVEEEVTRLRQENSELVVLLDKYRVHPALAAPSSASTPRSTASRPPTPGPDAPHQLQSLIAEFRRHMHDPDYAGAVEVVKGEVAKLAAAWGMLSAPAPPAAPPTDHLTAQIRELEAARAADRAEYERNLTRALSDCKARGDDDLQRARAEGDRQLARAQEEVQRMRSDLSVMEERASRTQERLAEQQAEKRELAMRLQELEAELVGAATELSVAKSAASSAEDRELELRSAYDKIARLEGGMASATNELTTLRRAILPIRDVAGEITRIAGSRPSSPPLHPDSPKVLGGDGNGDAYNPLSPVQNQSRSTSISDDSPADVLTTIATDLKLAAVTLRSKGGHVEDLQNDVLALHEMVEDELRRVDPSAAIPAPPSQQKLGKLVAVTTANLRLLKQAWHRIEGDLQRKAEGLASVVHELKEQLSASHTDREELGRQLAGGESDVASQQASQIPSRPSTPSARSLQTPSLKPAGGTDEVALLRQALETKSKELHLLQQELLANRQRMEEKHRRIAALQELHEERSHIIKQERMKSFELERKAKHLQEQLSRCRNKDTEVLERRLAEAEEALAARPRATEQVASLQNRLKDIEVKLEEARSEPMKLQKSLTETEQRLLEAQEQIQLQQELLASQGQDEEQIEEVRRELEHVKEQMEAAEREVEVARKRIVTLEGEVRDLKGDVLRRDQLLRRKEEELAAAVASSTAKTDTKAPPMSPPPLPPSPNRQQRVRPGPSISTSPPDPRPDLTLSPAYSTPPTACPPPLPGNTKSLPVGPSTPSHTPVKSKALPEGRLLEQQQQHHQYQHNPTQKPKPAPQPPQQFAFPPPENVGGPKSNSGPSIIEQRRLQAGLMRSRGDPPHQKQATQHQPVIISTSIPSPEDPPRGNPAKSGTTSRSSRTSPSPSPSMSSSVILSSSHDTSPSRATTTRSPSRKRGSSRSTLSASSSASSFRRTAPQGAASRFRRM